MVIGSQCHALGDAMRLEFLPGTAKDLFAVMTDPELGGCAEIVAGGLLLDPTVSATKNAIRKAYRAAANEESTLFLAYIGHGTYVGGDFFLLPLDAAERPNSDTGVNVIELIKEEHRIGPGADGIVVLIDACFSGVGALATAARWVGELAGTLRFEVLTSAADTPAYDGCFTKTLVAKLRNGIDEVPGDYLRCEHLRSVIRDVCESQVPQLPAYNADEGLFLARNQARARRTGKSPWAGTRTEEEAERLTACFQPTPVLHKILTTSQETRCVAVTGIAGVGKSTLAAALIQPERTHGVVATGFAHAAVFLSGATLTPEIANTLSGQLERSVPGFSAARAEFERGLIDKEKRRLDSLQRQIVGPLRSLRGSALVRVVIDGLDQLHAASANSMYSALEVLASDASLPWVRLVVTSRPNTPLPRDAVEVPIDVADDGLVASYLERRGVPLALRSAITDRAQGNWLIARLLADQALAVPDSTPDSLSADWNGLYASNLLRIGAGTTGRWRQEFRPVLGALAAAGVGPVLPMRLLCAASARLGGRNRTSQVRDLLVDLRGLVVREQAGTDAERVGLFHETLAGYLLSADGEPFNIDAQDSHRALAEAIAELAPADRHDADHPLHRYAMAREAEHLWAINDYPAVAERLTRRESVIPVENLKRWQSWRERLQSVPGLDDTTSFVTSQKVAHWTGESGGAREALRLSLQLLPDQERRLGAEHADTLVTRAQIAHWTGEAGDAREALRLYRALLPQRQHVLGPGHPDTLTTRHEIAHWTGEVGDAREALQLYRELHPDQEQILGPDHPATLVTRHSIAHWTGEVGNAGEALRLLLELLPDHRILGRDHTATLGTRHSIAHWTARTGEVRKALELYHELLPDRQRVQGPDHPDTLVTRQHIAHWTGESGDARLALRQFWKLLPDRYRIQGADHPATLMTRHDVAHWTGEAGSAREALRLFRELMPDRERVQGPDHPDTLATRHSIAHWTGETGDAGEALRLYRALLPDQERILGADHPETLLTRHDIAHWTGEMGDAGEALRLYIALLPERKRILGAEHPDTLGTRHSIAHWTALARDAREALHLFLELCSDRYRVQGPDHPDTLVTRHDIARWTGEAGEKDAALRLFRELLPDRHRVQGPRHPATFMTIHDIAHWTGETGNARESVLQFRKLLPRRRRIQGPDHPATLLTRQSIGHWTGEMGEGGKALRVFHSLLPDRVRVQGADHPATLLTRRDIAHWTGETGDAGAALHLYQALLVDQERILGADHFETLLTRHEIAHWTGELGDAAESLRLLIGLLPDRQRVLGPNHPATLVTRRDIAHWIGVTGDTGKALAFYQALLPDLDRALGPCHGDTEAARRDALWLESDSSPSERSVM
jgi:tetratricopeptide (TPR) repeat protein